MTNPTTDEYPVRRLMDRDRRVRIAAAYAALPGGKNTTDEIINFVRKKCRCRTISHFLDTAKESQVKILEGMLKL